jgi:hypothetical protein
LTEEDKQWTNRKKRSHHGLEPASGDEGFASLIQYLEDLSCLPGHVQVIDGGTGGILGPS